MVRIVPYPIRAARDCPGTLSPLAGLPLVRRAILGTWGKQIPNRLMDFTRRTVASEYLDAARHDPAVLDLTLDHLTGVNRWLGGARVITRHLETCLPTSGTLRVLDVGTGASDIPRAIVVWGKRRRRRVLVSCVDNQPQIASAAAKRSASDDAIHIAVADGLMLPFADDTFDVGISSLTLHHFADEPATAFIAELSRVSRHAVIINDLERHPVNYFGARLLAKTVWRGDAYTRHDGPISVLRSFNPAELQRVGEAAGLRNVRVHRHFPYRLALVGRPS